MQDAVYVLKRMPHPTQRTRSTRWASTAATAGRMHPGHNLYCNQDQSLKSSGAAGDVAPGAWSTLSDSCALNFVRNWSLPIGKTPSLVVMDRLWLKNTHIASKPLGCATDPVSSQAVC